MAFAKRTVNQADRHNLPFLASALTFDALLASIPFLVLLLVGLTHLAQLVSHTGADDINQLFHRFLPTGSAQDGVGPFAAIEQFLVGVTRARGTVSLYAIPLFLWFSTRLFASVRTALGLVYDAPRRPQHFVVAYLYGKLRDAMMVLLMVVLLLLNAALSAGLKVMDARGQELVNAVPTLGFFVTGVGQVIAELVAFGFSVSLFYLVYRHSSPRRLVRPAALAGSVFTAGLFEVAKRLYAWYLQNLAIVSRFSADATTGAVVLFVLWLYYTALVFLIGAVVAETWDLWHRQRGSGLRPVQLASGPS